MMLRPKILRVRTPSLAIEPGIDSRTQTEVAGETMVIVTTLDACVWKSDIARYGSRERVILCAYE